MTEKILTGRGRNITSIPRAEWESRLSRVPDANKIRLSFMTSEHHLVRYFVVKELTRLAKPITPEVIAEKLRLSLPRVKEILAELEERLVFLVRDTRGRVSWAFPVTIDETPHRLIFDTGERLNAA